MHTQNTTPEQSFAFRTLPQFRFPPGTKLIALCWPAVLFHGLQGGHPSRTRFNVSVLSTPRRRLRRSVANCAGASAAPHGGVQRHEPRNRHAPTDEIHSLCLGACLSHAAPTAAAPGGIFFAILSLT